MKKIISLSAMLILLATIGFVACKKSKDDSNPKTTNSNHQSAKRVGGVDDAMNNTNPYDEIGYWHNQALQATRSVWGNKLNSPQMVSDAIKQYLQSEGINEPFMDMSTILASNTMVTNDFNNGEVNLVNQTSLSDNAKSYMRTLFAIMVNAKDNSTYNSYKSKVMQVESNILNDVSLSGSEQKICLQTSSVARYSMLYWQNEAGNSNTEGSNPCECRLWNWIKDHWRNIAEVAIADGAGALLGGGLPGAAVGSGADILTQIINP